MCGVAGIIQYDGSPIQEQVFRRMWNSIRHRGQDDRGAISWDNKGHIPHFHQNTDIPDGSSALFNCRLAIQDLTSAGKMPMSTPDNKIWVSQNGEIYNFVELRKELETNGFNFRTRTDTEVILYGYLAWGFKKLLEKLNGDFAIILIDFSSLLLYMARDRFGIKPLYYNLDANVFRFASEVKGIFQDRRVECKPNNKMVFSYLSNMFPDPELEGQTFYSQICQVPTGSFTSLSLTKFPENITFESYWQPTLSKFKNVSDKELSEGFYNRFMHAVDIRTRCDVPIGLFLSGGLDSSSILGAVDRIRSNNKKEVDSSFEFYSKESPVNTISAVFPGEPHDEQQYIDIALKNVTQVKSHFLAFTSKNLLQDLDKIQYYHEEPLGPMNVLIQWELYRLAAEKGVKVVFDGLGGDELLGGYNSYRQGYLADIIRSAKFKTAIKESILLQKSGSFLNVSCHLAQAFWQNYPWKLRSLLRNFNLKKRCHFIHPSLRKCYRKWYEADQKLDPEKTPLFNSSGYLDRFLYLSLTGSWMNNSVPLAARYSDRNAMAHGIEPRVPFLDHELVEYVFATTNRMKYHKGKDRVIQRMGLKGILPEQIANRKDKMGFVTPNSLWMKTLFAARMQEFLNDKFLADFNYVKMNSLRSAFIEFINGRRQYDPVYWRTFCLFLWLNNCVKGSFKERNYS